MTTSLLGSPESYAGIFQCRLKSNLKRKFHSLFEGITEAGEPTPVNHIYTELSVIQGQSGQVNHQHECRQIGPPSTKPACSETTVRCEDVFRTWSNQDKHVRALVTEGNAGIGKTVLTQKYILDWAEEKATNIHFVFPFTFRELSLMTDKKYSLVDLLRHLFIRSKGERICRLEDFQVLFTWTSTTDRL